jgi:hypothetical protein
LFGLLYHVVQLYIVACHIFGFEASTVIEALKSVHVFHNLSTALIYTVLNQSHPLSARELMVPGHPALKLPVGFALFPM